MSHKHDTYALHDMQALTAKAVSYADPVESRLLAVALEVAVAKLLWVSITLCRFFLLPPQCHGLVVGDRRSCIGGTHPLHFRDTQTFCVGCTVVSIRMSHGMVWAMSHKCVMISVYPTPSQ